MSSGFVLIANAHSRRVALWQQARARLGSEPARIVSYLDLLCGRVRLQDEVRRDDVVRIESPGRDWEVERALLRLGADDVETGFDRFSHRELEALSFEKGRILAPRRWSLGWNRALQLIETQLGECAPHRLMNAPREIATMFDKPRCHQLLGQNGVRVPHALGEVRSFDELMSRLEETGCRRVFIKTASGSSASGMVALRVQGAQLHATTTVEMVSCGAQTRLFNSRRLQVHRDLETIARLIDALCCHRVHVEEWLPKAGFTGCTFDLRVVVIASCVRHTVVRMSRTPMTNLHLLNKRGDLELLRSRVPPEAWRAAMKTCEDAMKCFPDSLCGGVDLMWTPDYKRHAVLEVNAFGDLLPDVSHQGVDTYTAQLQAPAQRAPA